MNPKYLIFSLLLVLVGCGAAQLIPGFSRPSPTDQVLETITESQETLTILSGVGGLCLLAGMALLVISRGTTGWRPLIGGVLLILLNYIVARYADWIFIPVIIATGCVSAAWGWNIILSIIKERKNV